MLYLMTRHIKRTIEIIVGTILILAGVIMLFTPGPGIATIIGGIILVSPHHGKRVIYYIQIKYHQLKMYYEQRNRRK